MKKKKNIFIHRHTYRTNGEQITEHLHETQFSIDGEPQHLWGELKEVKSNKIKINDIRHGEGRNTPEGAYRQLEPFIDKKIYYGITNAMLPYISGQYSGIDIELKIQLNITYHDKK